MAACNCATCLHPRLNDLVPLVNKDIRMKTIPLDKCSEIHDELASIVNTKEIDKRIGELLAGFPIFSFGFGRGRIFWRARRAEGREFGQLKELWHRPPETTGMGRLNDPGKPCLYLSSHIETALAEIQANDGELIHVAGYRVVSDKEMRVAAIGELAHVHKKGYPRITGVDPDQSIARSLNKHPFETGLQIVYIDAILADLLADPNARARDYAVTRALASAIYKRQGDVMGMFYPSVRTDVGLNLALLPTPASDILHDVASVLVKVNRRHKFGYFDFLVLKTAIGRRDDGTFEWSTPRDPRSLNVYHLTKKEYEGTPATRPTLLDLAAHRAIPTDRADATRRTPSKIVK